MILLLFSSLLAQGPDTLWTRTYGGINDDQAYSVQQTFDEGYIIVGYTKSFGAGDADVYLVKTDSIGDTLWTRTYGNTLFDAGYSVQQTTDSGYIIAGTHLIKTDSLGDTLWTKPYGGGYSVKQIPDGGYIYAGRKITSFTYDVFLIRTDSMGDSLWSRTYGDDGYNDGGYSVQRTIDGGYIIAGNTNWVFDATYRLRSPGDLFIIKLDSLGDSLWSLVYGGAGDDLGRSVEQTSDSGFIVAGFTESFGAGDCDVWLIKTGADVGVEEKRKPNVTHNPQFRIYPNPFTTSTIIALPSIGHRAKSIELHIHDASGRLVKSVKLTTNTHQLGADLVPGVYFLKAAIGEHKETHKLIKIR